MKKENEKTCEDCVHQAWHRKLEKHLCVQGQWPAVVVAFTVAERWPDGEHEELIFLPACEKHEVEIVA